MIHVLNVNGKKLDLDSVCDTFITPYQPVDSAVDWIIKNHPALVAFKDEVKEIVCEWQMDKTLMEYDD